MLVLSRNDGQSIRISDRIEVTIVRVDRHRVKVGIVAPKEDHIVRAELLDESELPLRLKHH